MPTPSNIDNGRRPPPPPGFALFALGFRPFYLLASLFAALSIPLWALQFSGLLGQPYLHGPLWHAHEMIFGFTLAVIVGFLFTAGRSWTNQPTPAGWRLAALAGLWVLARVLVLTPYALAAALANMAFPLLAAIALARPLYKARSRRNYFFVGLLATMSIASGLIHASRLGWAQAPAWLGIQVALDIILFIVAVIAGRVIPMFTNNGVPGTHAKRHEWAEKAALGSLLVLMAASASELRGVPLASIAAVACVAHTFRWSLWQPWKTLRVPLVWVLHVAYLWVPIHLALRCFGESGWISPSLATHALTVGAMGGLIMGMMIRTARGHTGRPLVADGCDIACFVFILLAAVVRVLLPLVLPAYTVAAVLGSSALWSAGFALHAFRAWPVLSQPRLDGRPG